MNIVHVHLCVYPMSTLYPTHPPNTPPNTPPKNTTPTPTHPPTPAQGAVLSLAAANGALFSGGHDKTLRVWVMEPTTGAFACQAVLTAAQGGHKAPVQSLASVGGFLFSADWQGTLKVGMFLCGLLLKTLGCSIVVYCGCFCVVLIDFFRVEYVVCEKYVVYVNTLHALLLPSFLAVLCIHIITQHHLPDKCVVLHLAPLDHLPHYHAQVWDMSSGQCTQTILSAHQGIIMAMLQWEV